jgi:hypothetical protein
MGQRGAIVGAFVFGIIVTSAIAIAISFVRTRQGGDEYDLEDVRLVLERTPRPCPTLSNDVTPSSLQDAADIGGVMISVPAGYELMPASSSSPPNSPDVLAYASDRFAGPDLAIHIYPSLDTYSLRNLDGTRRPASSLEDVIHNQWDDYGIVGILPDCEPLITIRSDVSNRMTVGIAQRFALFDRDDVILDQRGFVELRDSRFIEVTLYGATTERPIATLENEFEAIIDSIARLN